MADQGKAAAATDKRVLTYGICGQHGRPIRLLHGEGFGHPIHHLPAHRVWASGRLVVVETTDGRLHVCEPPSSEAGNDNAISAAVAGLGVPRPLIFPDHARVAVAQVSLGTNFGLVVDESGALFVFGDNRCGQLGLGHTDFQENPVRVQFDPEYGSAVAVVAAGSHHSVIVTDENWVLICGNNESGQLGRQDGDASTWQPVTLGTVASGRDLAQHFGRAVGVAAGSAHTLVLFDDGGLWSAGRNVEGQCLGTSVSQRDAFEKANTLFVARNKVRTNLVPAAVFASANSTVVLVNDGAGSFRVLASRSQNRPPLEGDVSPYFDDVSPRVGDQRLGVDHVWMGAQSVIMRVDGTADGVDNGGDIRLFARLTERRNEYTRVPGLPTTTPADVRATHEIDVSAIGMAGGDVATLACGPAFTVAINQAPPAVAYDAVPEGEDRDVAVLLSVNGEAIRRTLRTRVANISDLGQVIRDKYNLASPPLLRRLDLATSTRPLLTALGDLGQAPHPRSVVPTSAFLAVEALVGTGGLPPPENGEEAYLLCPLTRALCDPPARLMMEPGTSGYGGGSSVRRRGRSASRGESSSSYSPAVGSAVGVKTGVYDRDQLEVWIGAGAGTEIDPVTGNVLVSRVGRTDTDFCERINDYLVQTELR